MIDMPNFRRIIESVAGDEAVIDKSTLLDIEAELIAGNAARLELARTTAIGTVCASIVAGPSA